MIARVLAGAGFGGIWIAGLVAASAAFAPAAGAAQSLPMPVPQYGDLCRQTGGVLAIYLTSGVGTVQCQWSGHGRTECKVGGGMVTICGIACQSNACLKDNPAKFTPTWPLSRGPKTAALPASPNTGTLAPAN